MASQYQGYLSKHLVSLGKFEQSIQTVLARSLELVSQHRNPSSLPTLIGVDVDYNGHDESVPTIRSFMKSLRSVHQKNFIRFVTDTLWAMESGNEDVFYTHDGPKEEWCDIVWTFRVTSDRQVEIGITQPINRYRNEVLDNLNTSLKNFVPGVCRRDDDRTLCDILLNFVNTTKAVDQVGYLSENFHIMLIPTNTRLGYYPVALHGLSYDAARRKGKSVVSQQEWNRRKFYEVFTEEVLPGENFYTLLGLINENDRGHLNPKTTEDTYALAEYLFGVYASNHDNDESDHDVVLFHALDRTVNRVETFRYSIALSSGIN